MIQGRDLSHLSEKDDGPLALELVRQYFDEEYLKRNTGHRIQELWSRPDRIATIELYTLGKCLEKFSGENQAWLKATIRKIKREPHKSHGLFTEI